MLYVLKCMLGIFAQDYDTSNKDNAVGCLGYFTIICLIMVVSSYIQYRTYTYEQYESTRKMGLWAPSKRYFKILAIIFLVLFLISIIVNVFVCCFA